MGEEEVVESFSIALDKPVTALSSSYDGQLVAVVVWQILQWKDSRTGDIVKHWESVRNMRSGRTSGIYKSCDVKWNLIHHDKVATASTGGSVIVWNINRNAKKLEKRIDVHQRIVKKIDWHPTEPDMLLTGSHDKTARIFDTRQGSEAAMKFDALAEVCDVQFHPQNRNLFASASEGLVKIWDWRTGSVWKVVNAHYERILAIDWHSSLPGTLATASQDRSIKVWNTIDTPRNSHFCETGKGVARVKWRPGSRTQIVSTSIVDTKIHIWDTSRPNIPLYTIKENRDTVQAILFDTTDPEGNILISGSKDGVVSRFDIRKNAISNLNHVPSGAVEWKPDNELAFCFGEVFTPERALIERKELSRKRIKSTSIPEMLNHLFSPTNPRSVSVAGCTSTQPLYSFFRGEPFTKLAKEYKLNGLSFRQLCDYNYDVAYRNGEMEIANIWRVLQVLYSVEKPKKAVNKEGQFWGDSFSDIIFDEPNSFDWIPKLAFPEQKTNVTAFGSEIILDQDIHLPMKIPSEDETSFFQAPPDVLLKQKLISKRNNKLSSIQVPDFQFQPCISEMLDFHASKGDVQTCVSTLIVLGKKYEVSIEKKTMWFTSYIELLEKFELFTQANHIINLCPVDEIKSKNQKGTTYRIGCSVCMKNGKGRTMEKGWICEKCRSVKSCSICKQPVKGLYIWCQGCGHGGHLQHLKKWYANPQTKSICSFPGCTHRCDIK